jgi:hypothetical protein
MIRSFATFSMCVALLVGAAHAEETKARPPASSLTHPKGATQSVDARGFIHRWLVLEPIPFAGRLTESSVQEAVQSSQLPEQAASLARDGDSVKLGNSTSKWHALETLHYNFNLYHFAYALSKPTSNVLFWVTTAIDSPQEMRGVRLAIGSNAASRWWLNDEPVIALDGDRQTVIDDGVSQRITLHKGRNVIRAAIINGGGATDFCARFLDANDKPISNLKVSLTESGEH